MIPLVSLHPTIDNGSRTPTNFQAFMLNGVSLVWEVPEILGWKVEDKNVDKELLFSFVDREYNTKIFFIFSEGCR